jgi:ribonuclease G
MAKLKRQYLLSIKSYLILKSIKNHKKVVLNVHPFVRIPTKVFHHYVQMVLEHKKNGLKIIPRDAYTYLEYHFFVTNKEML